MKAQESIRRHLLITVVAVFILVGGIGGWAATSEFAGAVIAQGQLVVDTNVKKVQHPTGGVVAELNVQEGDKVKAGEIVIKLDDTQTRANLQIVSKGLDELMARRAREAGMPHLLLIPCLFLTFMFGPIGLVLFLTLRAGLSLRANPLKA